MRWLILVCLAVLCSFQLQAKVLQYEEYIRKKYRTKNMLLKRISCAKGRSKLVCSLYYTLPPSCHSLSRRKAQCLEIIPPAQSSKKDSPSKKSDKKTSKA
ncbi:hypothetical protein GCK32_009856 [Trichostrongylus colubriformis]|uniref:Secreted protein n=1 Tax=Trichostrongylus colubriformis TaxID=6319 RepID=A0AAN8F3T3_TRICO